MANEQHLAALRQGTIEWNDWRRRNPRVSPDLSGADLRNADLRRAVLSKADLRDANLSWAKLDWASLDDAILIGAKLTRAELFGANLAGANLAGANLQGSFLHGAYFNWADLGQANLKHASIGATVFGNVDLSEVVGLETVKHEGPSSLGIDTIYQSKGRIPESFLRNAGVPDNFLTYMHSLTGAAFDFHSCFISYATANQGFAERLHADLQAKGVRCWFAPHDIQGGRKIHEQIDQAIRVHDKLLLILSEESIGSTWVEFEIRRARRREVQEKRRMLFPLRLASYDALRAWECFDADTAKDLATEVREYFIPDFSDWKNHDAYQRGFERLLGDLKAEQEESATGAQRQLGPTRWPL